MSKTEFENKCYACNKYSTCKSSYLFCMSCKVYNKYLTDNF